MSVEIASTFFQKISRTKFPSKPPFKEGGPAEWLAIPKWNPRAPSVPDTLPERETEQARGREMTNYFGLLLTWRAGSCSSPRRSSAIASQTSRHSRGPSLSAWIWPWWTSTIALLMARPRPRPSRRSSACSKASRIRSLDRIDAGGRTRSPAVAKAGIKRLQCSRGVGLIVRRKIILEAADFATANLE